MPLCQWLQEVTRCLASCLTPDRTFRATPTFLTYRHSLPVQVAGRLQYSSMRSCLSVALLFATSAHSVALPGIRNHWSDTYSLRPNPLYPYVRSPAARSRGNISTYDSRFWKDSDIFPSRTRRSTKDLKFEAGSLQPRQDASTTSEQYLDTRPTPDPTGVPSVRTTVFITSENDFALLLPKDPGGMFEFCTDYEALIMINAFRQSSYPRQRWTR